VLSWWTFTDVFEEGGLPTTEFQDIYGLMTYHGIPKPGWRAFQLLHSHAGTHRVPTTVSKPNVQVPFPFTGESTSTSASAHASASEGGATGATTRSSASGSGSGNGSGSGSLQCGATLSEGTDFGGNDLLPETQHLMLPGSDECCSACANYTGAWCVWVGVWGGGVCVCMCV
jgi:hypothetical protein